MVIEGMRARRRRQQYSAEEAHLVGCPDLLHRNVDVVDVENGITLDGYNVLVEAGIITNVSQDSIEADGALVVDGGLQTTVPGVYATGALRSGYGGQLVQALADGITAAQSVARAVNP